MSPDYRKQLKHIEPEKRQIKISDEEKKLLEKYSVPDEPSLTAEQMTVLDILTKRKTLRMITREYNLALKPLGKELVTEGKISEILQELKRKELIKSVIGGDGQEYWVNVKYFRDKLFGTERL
ncbi:MAG: hypothetical protein ACTSYB_17640 [Candidatus Helarchaeota archaeon]